MWKEGEKRGVSLYGESIINADEVEKAASNVYFILLATLVKIFIHKYVADI